LIAEEANDSKHHMDDFEHPGSPIQFQADFFKLQPVLKPFFELYEYLPNVYFYVKDTRHRYVGANRAVLRDVFGLESQEQLWGKTDLDFQPPVLAEAYHGEDRQVMEENATIPNRVWLVPHVAGTPKWYVSTKTPMHDPRGSVIGIVGVMYPVESPKDREDYFQDLAPVIAALEARFDENLSMKEMADLAGLSSTQFNLRFRKLLRMSPTEYVLRLRVEAAQQRLLRTDREIADIGMDVGFFDQSHFTRRFREITGITPLTYRRRFGKNVKS
jgi:AraC-like DNA-binding protein